jgi:manganese oxidase
MNKRVFKLMALSIALAVGPGLPQAHAVIDGVTGTIFNLSAKAGHISTPDGGSYYMWGYAEDPNGMQYPGPTLIVAEDVPITINLTNTLAIPVSMVFPGQSAVTSTGGSPGLLTSEAAPSGGTISYSFTPTEPGTYMYHSGTSPELQIEMGLVGALIVRPTGAPGQAYAHADSAFDHEFLFLETEMDPDIHVLVEQGNIAQVDFTTWYPVYWFFNGRCFPDTLTPAGTPTLPSQPYNCLATMYPGQKVLQRFVSAGRDSHPQHTHGNNDTLIARDGRLLQSAPGAGTDLAIALNTLSVPPGGTADSVFTWTGAHLGWDIYGHDPNDPLEPGEYAPDHGKPFPLTLPSKQDLTFGGLYSGSPFLGGEGALPPGEGGLNPLGAYPHIWHSHHEKEVVNNDLFPGGMISFVLVLPPE